MISGLLVSEPNFQPDQISADLKTISPIKFLSPIIKFHIYTIISCLKVIKYVPKRCLSSAKSKHYSSTVMLEKLFCVLSARYSKIYPSLTHQVMVYGSTCYTWVILNIIFSKKNYMAPAMPGVNSLPGFYFCWTMKAPARCQQQLVIRLNHIAFIVQTTTHGIWPLSFMEKMNFELFNIRSWRVKYNFK